MDLHLDFETFCEADIFKVGHIHYAAHHSCSILMAAWWIPTIHSSNPSLWVPAEGQPLPDLLRSALEGPDTQVYAYNAPFEQAILFYQLGIWIPPARLHCSQALGLSLGFSGGLADMGAQVGLPGDKQKLREGKALIRKFCVPHPGATWERCTATTHPDDWTQFKRYCLQDVKAEAELGTQLEALK